jgi:hypothetical protein
VAAPASPVGSPTRYPPTVDKTKNPPLCTDSLWQKFQSCPPRERERLFGHPLCLWAECTGDLLQTLHKQVFAASMCKGDDRSGSIGRGWQRPLCTSRDADRRKTRSDSSRRRSPQPSKTARIARSRLLFGVPAFGSCQRERACSAVNQFPNLTPNLLDPFTLRIPAASSGLSKPASAASSASLRTAASLTFVVPGASRRSSR